MLPCENSIGQKKRLRKLAASEQLSTSSVDSLKRNSRSMATQPRYNKLMAAMGVIALGLFFFSDSFARGGHGHTSRSSATAVRPKSGNVTVKGYYQKDGTYVNPHIRTAPNRNPYDNFSFPGNYNPNTGRITLGNPSTYLNRYYSKSGGSVSHSPAGGLVPGMGNVTVNGYYRKDGTYVMPHIRTTPDGNPYNNFSFPGNYNPNTGRITGGSQAAYLNRYYNSASGSTWLSPSIASGLENGGWIGPITGLSALGNPLASSAQIVPMPTSKAQQQVAMVSGYSATLPLVPHDQDCNNPTGHCQPFSAEQYTSTTVPALIAERSTKVFASLVQYDGPKIKSGITLEAEFIDNGSGSGDGRVIYPGNRYLLNGNWTTLPLGKVEKPKLIDKKALNALRLAADVPLTTSHFADNDTILECLHGETASTSQRKGECQDNYGNKYHLVFRP